MFSVGVSFRIVLALASCVFALSTESSTAYARQAQPDAVAVPFELIRQALPPDKRTPNEFYETIDITISGGRPIRLGSVRHVHDEDLGLNTKSIKTQLLRGEPDLVLVSWETVSEGMGGYQTSYLMVLCAHTPSAPLLAQFQGAGSGGVDMYAFGEMSVEYSAGLLKLIVFESLHFSSDKPRALYHKNGVVDGKYYPSDDYNIYARTTVVKTYRPSCDRLQLLRTDLEYVSQPEDTILDVTTYFKVKEEWIGNPADIGKEGTKILMSIPAAESEQRYPTINYEKEER